MRERTILFSFVRLRQELLLLLRCAVGLGFDLEFESAADGYDAAATAKDAAVGGSWLKSDGCYGCCWCCF